LLNVHRKRVSARQDRDIGDLAADPAIVPRTSPCQSQGRRCEIAAGRTTAIAALAVGQNVKRDGAVDLHPSAPMPDTMPSFGAPLHSMPFLASMS
jgi:hypothetical protein